MANGNDFKNKVGALNSLLVANNVLFIAGLYFSKIFYVCVLNSKVGNFNFFIVKTIFLNRSFDEK